MIIKLAAKLIGRVGNMSMMNLTKKVYPSHEALQSAIKNNLPVLEKIRPLVKQPTGTIGQSVSKRLLGAESITKQKMNK